MLAFDHLVIFSENPENDQRAISNEHRLTLTKGGHHENWGTYNYLAFMGNHCYIEWIGIEDQMKVDTSDNPLIQHVAFSERLQRYGPIQFALRTSNLDSLIKHYEENAIPYKGPYPGQRRRPDGTMMKWRMLFPEYDVQQEVLPFLIEWEDGENHPPRPDLTNDEEFSSIQIGVSQLKTAIERIKKTYMLPEPRLIEKENGIWSAEWDLENGLFKLTEGSGLHAVFDNASFHS
ncbi:MAG: VOC family protein [Bacillaceae bacterium]|nr:VOC family protein [Bacillaceae bacterium]